MFHAFQALAGTAAMERATLLMNHILAAEPAATQRLRGHVGRCVAVQAHGWPSALAALPDLSWRITAAGLLEYGDPAAAQGSALRIDIDLSNPAKLALAALAGTPPRIEVAGDAALAADIAWLFDNLRWDIEDDLEGIVGPAAARQLCEIGRAVFGAVRGAAQTLAGRGRSSEPLA